jgi:subtilisin family serine protease
MTMRIPDRLLLTLAATGSRPKLPSHLDCLLGAVRPAGRVGDQRIDRALAIGEDYQVSSVYHARASLGRVGEQALNYDDVEEALGLSRTYAVSLADPTRSTEVVDRLQQLATVQSASVQYLAVTPFEVAIPRGATGRSTVPPGVDPWEPHDQVRSRQAHELEPGDQNVWVGLVDTGISLPHPEFRRRLLAGYDTVQLGMGRTFGTMSLVGDSLGEDFSPRDDVGHGSHVGGVIAAHGWRLPPGVAGRSMILPIRVLAAGREHGRTKLVGIGAESDINAGLKVGVDMGADVLNLSFGTPASSAGGQVRPHGDVIQYATHYGCTLVAAMGNSGTEEDYYPAAYPEVIAVGSVDRNGRRSAFSTIGKHIALSAPGEDIVSAGRRGYDIGSGTSFAAPFVAGAAALLVARARRRGRKLRGPEVKSLLMSSARSVDGGPQKEIGSGVLDIVAALGRLDELLGSGASPGRA